MVESANNVFTRGRRRVLMLYDHRETHVKTIAHHLESFHRYSTFDYSYVSSYSRCDLDLDYFDAVVLHYSVRVCHAGHLSRSFERALRAHQGLKAIFVQDEYEHTFLTHQAIRDLGITVVFTCVPEVSIATVYPPATFPNVRFVPVLTGYVPLDFETAASHRPIAERPILIGYRGRRIGPWYGDLGQEKLVIGERMKSICDARGLVTDIAWEEQDRIYGGWFAFLASCKATLGTESGANVFDWDGKLALSIQREQYRHPDIAYREIREKYLRGREGEVRMNQISPKVFEAIATRTALVLFEGHYSGIVEPYEHFLPLQKDFGNVDEVLDALGDSDSLEGMADRAFADVIGSGRYAYPAFVRMTDSVLAEDMRPQQASVPPWLPVPAADALPTFSRRYARVFGESLVWKLGKSAVSRDRLKRWWILSPEPVRTALRPIFHLSRRALKQPHGR